MSHITNLTVVYDACVLYLAPLRDFLMELALKDLIRARWTDAIHDEWIRNVIQRRPDLKPEQLQRTRSLMNANVLDCLVTGYEPLIDVVTLPDPDDRHVLAAAIHAGADVIVTFNTRDFPAESLHRWGIEAQHPDDFLTSQFDLAPHILCEAARQTRARLRNPPKTVVEYLTTLEAQGLPQFVAALRRFSELI